MKRSIALHHFHGVYSENKFELENPRRNPKILGRASFGLNTVNFPLYSTFDYILQTPQD